MWWLYFAVRLHCGISTFALGKMCLTKYFFLMKYLIILLSLTADYFIVFDRFAYDGGKYSYGYSER